MVADARKEAIYEALARLPSEQLARIPAARTMVCDGFAFDARTGRY